MSDIDKKIDAIKKKLALYQEDTKKKYVKALQLCGQKVERDAKLLWKGKNEPSVKGEPPRVQTGRARGSITHILKDDMMGPYMEVGTNVEYGPKLEFGSSTSWPHPFMTPAVDMNKDFIKETLKEALA